MSKALVRREGGGGSGNGSGVVPAVCSAIIPGVGQLVNGETDKAIGVFAIYAVAGAGFGEGPTRHWHSAMAVGRSGRPGGP